MKLSSQNDHQAKAWRYAIASVACSALAVPTLFLILPIVLFPIIGVILAFKAGKHYRRGQQTPSRGAPLLFILPVGFAILVCGGCLALVANTYRA